MISKLSSNSNERYQQINELIEIIEDFSDYQFAQSIDDIEFQNEITTRSGKKNDGYTEKRLNKLKEFDIEFVGDKEKYVVIRNQHDVCEYLNKEKHMFDDAYWLIKWFPYTEMKTYNDVVKVHDCFTQVQKMAYEPCDKYIDIIKSCKYNTDELCELFTKAYIVATIFPGSVDITDAYKLLGVYFRFMGIQIYAYNTLIEIK